MRGDGKTWVAVDEGFELLLLLLCHELRVMVAGECTEYVEESISGDDGLVFCVDG